MKVYGKLEMEREKLDRMVDEAFGNDLLMLQGEAIQKQCRRVERMIERTQKEDGGGAKILKSGC